MNKKISIGAGLTVLFLAIAATVATTYMSAMFVFNKEVSITNQRDQMLEKIEEIDRVVQSNFFGNIPENIIDSIGSGYVSGLGDQYSRYLSAEEYERHVQQNEGTIMGIGCVIEKDTSGYIKIIQIYKDSPAEAVELNVGDLITKIDSIDTSGMSVTDAQNRITGKEGTRVALTVFRSGTEISTEVMRRRLEIPSVEYRKIGDFGYIKITEFNNATIGQFNTAYNDLLKNGVAGFVFDVRGNSGGLLHSVNKILDQLLPEGPIVREMRADNEIKVIAESDASECLLPIAVLQNSSTASAAELFASALRDYGKAKLVGTQSFGKGVMQDAFKLKDGSAVILTVAQFLPPFSDNFNIIGLKPDFEVMLTAEQQQNLLMLDETSDPQLIKALEVVSNASKQ